MTITVRPAVREDAPALFRLWQAMLRHYTTVDRRIVPSPATEQQFAEALEETLADAFAAAFVAEDEGTLVGFVSGGIESAPPSRLPDRHLTIGHFYVVPPYRGLGIGRQLFRAIAEWGMKTADIHHFEMTVLEADREAREFWSRLGFTAFIQRLWAPLSVLDDDKEAP